MEQRMDDGVTLGVSIWEVVCVREGNDHLSPLI